MSNSEMMVPNMPTGMVAREDGFGGRELTRVAEQQAIVMAAAAKAMIQARYQMALAQPRSWMKVRDRLLLECERPRFASTARFSVERGKKQDPKTGRWVDNYIEGPSIRFAEAALRCMTNVLPETRVLVDDDDKRIVQVSVTDLEANITYQAEIVVAKRIERKKPRSGDIVISERANTYGDTVFLVIASDDEVVTKQNAMISKSLRTLALRLLPGDILDECMERCMAVVANADAKDPMAARKALKVSLEDVGVDIVEAERWLGCQLMEAPPPKLRVLRSVATAIKDGTTSWEAFLHSSADDGAAAAASPKPTATERVKAAAGVAPAVSDAVVTPKAAEPPPAGTAAAPPPARGRGRPVVEAPPPPAPEPEERRATVAEADAPPERQPGDD